MIVDCVEETIIETGEIFNAEIVGTNDEGEMQPIELYYYGESHSILDGKYIWEIAEWMKSWKRNIPFRSLKLKTPEKSWFCPSFS